MISIGIDVSKRKSTVAMINVMGEVLQTPFDIEHIQSGLNELFGLIKDYPKNQVRFILPFRGIKRNTGARLFCSCSKSIIN